MFLIPTWNQLDDRLPDDGLDPQRDNDCGEECAAMTIWAYRGGLSFSAGCLRQAIPGHSSSGLTNGVDLQTLLHRFRIDSSTEFPDRPTDFAHHVLSDGRLVLALTTFSLTNSTTHWRLVVGQQADKQGVIVNDPWGGTRRGYTNGEFHALYAGAMLEILERVPGWVPTR